MVYVFFNLRNNGALRSRPSGFSGKALTLGAASGIQLSEPFGYKARHLPVPEFLMRSYIDHRDLLGDGLSAMKPEGTAIEGVSPPNFIAPLRAKYDAEWGANFKATSGAVQQLQIMQRRFGFPGITQEDRQKPQEKSVGPPAAFAAPAGTARPSLSAGANLAATESSQLAASLMK